MGERGLEYAEGNGRPESRPFPKILFDMGQVVVTVTIDDLAVKAQELVDGLHRLQTYRHPLSVYRGVPKTGMGVSEEMPEKSEDRDSLQVKGAGRTYFLDMGRTSKDTPYLRITESRKGEGEEFERSSIYVFPEDAEQFSTAVQEMTGKLAE